MLESRILHAEESKIPYKLTLHDKTKNTKSWVFPSQASGIGTVQRLEQRKKTSYTVQKRRTLVAHFAALDGALP